MVAQRDKHLEALLLEVQRGGGDKQACLLLHLYIKNECPDRDAAMECMFDYFAGHRVGFAVLLFDCRFKADLVLPYAQNPFEVETCGFYCF